MVWSRRVTQGAGDCYRPASDHSPSRRGTDAGRAPGLSLNGTDDERSGRTTHSERTRIPMASKPILLTVDDDPEVLRAIERDLWRHYGKDYRVLRADAGVTALDVLRQVDARGEPVALFLVDQRMPQMSGVEFLEQARAVFPDAKRMLLTAYADTDAAINAINAVKVDYYSLKP